MSKKYDVFGMGNALVDFEFEVDDSFFEENGIQKGLMTLVDEERQNFLMDVLHNIPAKKQCGGSAANTVIALSQFGGKSYYSCKVADDDTGHFYAKDLKENGVDSNLDEQRVPVGITGKCLVMISPDAERTMNTFLGITAEYDSQRIDEEALANSEYLYIEGYLITGPDSRDAIRHAMKLARKHNTKIAMTFSDPGIIAGFKEEFHSLLEEPIDMLFCNEAEALSFTDTETVIDAREALKPFAKHFAITQGKNGAIIYDGLTYIDIEPYPVEAINTNGAGDMFAGAFLYGLTQNHGFAQSGIFAAYASSKVVTVMGPRLDMTDAKEVSRIITEL
ncbi:adenosine kinase [Marinigracilibium pacificum]|uniref:Adenosine kinase n=1 Tax=Marinigracilibium pacificum TaxID=2729599 RepID=A0A848IVE6_9BACT|nr:adenosine kinase [Marinigracilibium pacificum]NMM47255.1 adenosine kinase [Marinigracilibium pacificum]